MVMFIFVRILCIVYVVAVNVYSFLLLRNQKKSAEEGEKRINDVRLYVTAILGGGLGIYVGMFCMKYRLNNFFLMVLMPIFICATAFLVVFGFINDFGFNL